MTDAMLSLVIPCFNEAQSLPELVTRCGQLTMDGRIEVVFVDNGSTDETATVLPSLIESAPGCRAVRVGKNEGYGFGILQGLAAANTEWLAWTHADLQTDVADLKVAIDLAIAGGTRVFVKGQRCGRPLADRIFTHGMSLFESALFQSRLWDINAQPNVFHRSFYEGWKSPPKDFSLDLYVLVEAKRQGLELLRFPVEFGERRFGQSHWNVDWSSKWRFIKRTLKFSLELRRRSAHAHH